MQRLQRSGGWQARHAIPGTVQPSTPGALLFVLVASVLVAFGGSYPSATSPILVGSVAVFALTYNATRLFSAPTRALDRALLTVAAGITVQLVPLPRALVDALSPAAGPVRDTLALDTIVRSPDGWQPLTLDVDQTLHALATYLSAVLIFWAARGVFTIGGARVFCRRLAWFAAAMSVVALASRATSPRLLYGVWQPEATNATPFGPYVDRNLFAAWLMIAVFLTGSYVILERRKDAAHRSFRDHLRAAGASAALPMTVCVAIIAATLALTLSRGAIVGFVAGVAVMLPPAFRRLNVSARAAGITVTIASLLIVATAPAALVERFSGSFDASSSPTGRLVIWRETLRIVRDFWFSGTGAGAFEHAMLVYQQSEQAVFFNFAHNQYLQVAAEGGLLIGLGTLWAAAAFARLASSRVRSDASERYWLRLGGAAAVLGVAVHGLWDFPIQMPGNALLFAVAAALVVAPAPKAHRPTRRQAPLKAPLTSRLT